MLHWRKIPYRLNSREGLHESKPLVTTQGLSCFRCFLFLNLLRMEPKFERVDIENLHFCRKGGVLMLPGFGRTFCFIYCLRVTVSEPAQL